MIQITLVDPQVNVQALPNGLKLLAFTDQQSGIRILVPCSPDDAKRLGSVLASNIEVAPVDFMKDIQHGRQQPLT